MKRISLFILLSIAGINTCAAMSPKNAKINPAIAAATIKLQTKPILFFNQGELQDQYEGRFNSLNSSSVLVAKGRSLEYNHWKEQCNELVNLCNRNNISNSEKEEYTRKLYLHQEKEKNINHKINVILESIAKRFNASAVIPYPRNGFFFIDPAYDITDEVCETLNKEYLASSKACNQSCCVHCPLKNTQH